VERGAEWLQESSLFLIHPDWTDQWQSIMTSLNSCWLLLMDLNLPFSDGFLGVMEGHTTHDITMMEASPNRYWLRR